MGSTYSYKVRDGKGQLRSGKLTAASSDVLARKLDSDGFNIIEIRKQRVRRESDLNISIGKRVKTRDLMLFARQFAVMLGAGLPLLKCLQIMKVQSSNYHLQKSINRVITDVEHGMPFWKALRGCRGVFPRFFVYMVKSGEMSGSLCEVMQSIAFYLERQDELAKKVSRALFYPAVVGFFALGVVVFMLLYIMPEFVSMYQNKEAALPLITRIVMAAGSYLRLSLPWILMLGALLMVLVNRWRRTREGRLAIDRIVLKLPAAGEVIRKLSAARFARTMGMLLGSGVPLLGALQVSEELAGNAVIAEQIVKAGQSVQEGRGLADPLSQCGAFDAMAIQIIAVGEQTGTLAEALTGVSDYYEKDVSYMVDFLVALIEPGLILFLAVVVGSIVIACMLPMMQMSMLMGQ